MMPRFVRLVAPLVILSCAGGCLPATFTDMPAFRGRVVDGAGRPVSGANVSVAPKDASRGGHGVEVTTDRDGRFHRDEEVHFGFALLLPLDSITPQFIARARVNDVESKPVQFGGGITNPHYLGVTNPSQAFDLRDLLVP